MSGSADHDPSSLLHSRNGGDIADTLVRLQPTTVFVTGTGGGCIICGAWPSIFRTLFSRVSRYYDSFQVTCKRTQPREQGFFAICTVWSRRSHKWCIYFRLQIISQHREVRYLGLGSSGISQETNPIISHHSACLRVCRWKDVQKRQIMHLWFSHPPPLSRFSGSRAVSPKCSSPCPYFRHWRAAAPLWRRRRRRRRATKTIVRHIHNIHAHTRHTNLTRTHLTFPSNENACKQGRRKLLRS